MQINPYQMMGMVSLVNNADLNRLGTLSIGERKILSTVFSALKQQNDQVLVNETRYRNIVAKLSAPPPIMSGWKVANAVMNFFKMKLGSEEIQKMFQGVRLAPKQELAYVKGLVVACINEPQEFEKPEFVKNVVKDAITEEFINSQPQFKKDYERIGVALVVEDNQKNKTFTGDSVLGSRTPAEHAQFHESGIASIFTENEDAWRCLTRASVTQSTRNGLLHAIRSRIVQPFSTEAAEKHVSWGDSSIEFNVSVVRKGDAVDHLCISGKVFTRVRTIFSDVTSTEKAGEFKLPQDDPKCTGVITTTFSFDTRLGADPGSVDLSHFQYQHKYDDIKEFLSSS